MPKFIRRLADWDDPGSLGNRLRTRRMEQFERLLAPIPRPVRILDVGGTTAFWDMRGWSKRDDVRIVTINLKAEERRFDAIEPRVGDATNLREYPDNHFDVAFSNSVIEHLFTLENQRAMADEMRRVARMYWVQTPNFWFPVEPHFHIPGWQLMPVRVRIWLLQHFRCGWRGPCQDPAEARRLVEEVRLMTRRELQSVFPDGVVLAERFGGLVKSWIICRTADPVNNANETPVA